MKILCRDNSYRSARSDSSYSLLPSSHMMHFMNHNTFFHWFLISHPRHHPPPPPHSVQLAAPAGLPQGEEQDQQEQAVHSHGDTPHLAVLHKTGACPVPHLLQVMRRALPTPAPAWDSQWSPSGTSIPASLHTRDTGTLGPQSTTDTDPATRMSQHMVTPSEVHSNPLPSTR